MNEPEIKTQSTDQPESETPAQTTGRESETATEQTTVQTSGPKRKTIALIGAVVVVVVIIVGVLYLLEREGRVSTGLFDSVIAQQEAGAVVAVVNGQEIVGSDLQTSVAQFQQAAAAQGVDSSSEQAQAEIRAQALEVLVNTELLKQEAVAQGIEVSDQEAVERLATIEEELGGAEVLAERMATLGLDEEQLQSDVRDEILIQELLDTVFAEAEIEVTEEEVNAVYDNASAGAAGSELPPLEEVRTQIETQIITSKEQQIVDEFISTLRADADIELIGQE